MKKDLENLRELSEALSELSASVTNILTDTISIIEKISNNIKEYKEYEQDKTESENSDPLQYRQGQRFLDTETDEEYVLAQTDKSVMSLISIIEGNRYAPPVEVRDISAINPCEFGEIAGNEPEVFALIG